MDNNTDKPVVSSPSVGPAPTRPSLGHRLRLLFWKLVALLLLIALVAVIVLWKPWQPNIKASDRTVSVTGTATIKSEPDQYEFNPSYQFTNADKQTALSTMTSKSNEITAKLKTLGVSDSQIKTNSSNYGDLYSTSSAGTTYTLTYTIDVASKDLAQKVQDYLVSTGPSGSVTPQTTFSTTKQKALESQARDKAEQDARAKAEQSAKNLGFKVNTVKSVEDGSFDNSPCGGGLCYGANSLLQSTDTNASLAVQPGQNDLNYSVKVTFYIH